MSESVNLTLQVFIILLASLSTSLTGKAVDNFSYFSSAYVWEYLYHPLQQVSVWEPLRCLADISPTLLSNTVLGVSVLFAFAMKLCTIISSIIIHVFLHKWSGLPELFFWLFQEYSWKSNPKYFIWHSSLNRMVERKSYLLNSINVSLVNKILFY